MPTIRNGQEIGLLIVQNREQRDYVDEEIETFETVSIVLARLPIANELTRREELLLY